MLHLLFSGGFFNGWFWHPDRTGNGYNSWSGILGSFLFSLPGWVFGLIMWLRHKNCHVKGCKSFHTQSDPDHGWPACIRHHSQKHKLGKDPNATL